MSPGTRGADAQGPGWVDDPQAVEVGEEGTHDVGQVGRKSQWWNTRELWLRTQLWLKTIQGWKTQKAQDQEQGQPPILFQYIVFSEFSGFVLLV